MSPKESIILKNIGIAALIISLLSLVDFTSILKQLEKLIQLRNNGTEITAVVVATNCPNHGDISYAFNLKGQHIQTTSHDCGVSCASTSAGDPLNVTYLSDKPSVSDCGSVQGKIDQVWSGFYTWLFVCVVIICIFALKSLKEFEELHKS